MSIHNYNDEIALLLECNPGLSNEMIGVLLTADSLYKSVPEDQARFRELFAHMDPMITANNHEKLIFLKFVKDRSEKSIIRQRLNSYLNIKFNDITHLKTYEQNRALFREYSGNVSEVIDGVLKWADFPKELVSILREKEEVRKCHDFYRMLQLYRDSDDARLRFEILRKLGLIILIARIRRSVLVQEMDDKMISVWKALRKRLGHERKSRKRLHFWLDPVNKVRFSEGKKTALEQWKKDMRSRQCIALKGYPMQVFDYVPFMTPKGIEIVHMEIRNKLKKDDKTDYTSFVEKMVRKNLEFPNQVRDVIGVKIVVNSEDDIQNMIDFLESFLGGSSTRKKEKNSYHKFGRRTLSRYSSKDYFVWKAIYDITLPHPALDHVQKMVELTKGNSHAQKELKERYMFLVDNPTDFIMEVQLQDVNSYLQSIVHGSPTAHTLLKKNQVRSNSFYKFFPKEIYEKDILALKNHTICE